MTWTTPMTFLAGSTITAAQLNTYLRDNLNETAPAKATTAGRIFVSTGAGAIAERAVSSDVVATSETKSGSTYGDLATVGPAVTITTGTQALVGIACRMSTNTANVGAAMSFGITGATTNSADDTRAVIHPELGSAVNAYTRMGAVTLMTGLTAGSNTFTAKYATLLGLGETGTFQDRRIWVIAL